MYRGQTYIKTLSVALLCMGSAIWLISCRNNNATIISDNTPTMRSDSVTVYESKEGGLVSRYYTPLMEKYENAAEPYDEYKYGVEIIQYDSLGNVKSTFHANYAIHFINVDLWETKGDVVVTNETGDRLETQQLFWNRKTGRVYSNVDTHFYKTDGLLRGESFESNEDLSDWEVRKARGTITLDVEPTRDTTKVAQDSLPPPNPDAQNKPTNNPPAWENKQVANPDAVRSRTPSDTDAQNSQTTNPATQNKPVITPKGRNNPILPSGARKNPMIKPVIKDTMQVNVREATSGAWEKEK